MTLPVGTISLSQVNTELGRSATALIDMNDAAVRTLAGVGGSGTIISMSNLQGKSAFTLAIQGSTGPVEFEKTANAADVGIKLVIGADGTIRMFADQSLNFTTTTPDSAITTNVSGAVTNFPTAWGTPITAGVGSGYEVNYSGLLQASGSVEIVRVFGVGYQNTGEPEISITTPYYALSSDRTITLFATGLVDGSALAILGENFFSSSNNGTISIRRIGTTSPVVTFTIGAIIADKSGS